MKLENFQFVHRLTGFIVAILVLFLAVTGIFLNHTSELGLDEKYIDLNWLLDWYEIKPAHAPVSYRAGGAWSTQVDSRLYFNDMELAENAGSLRGIVDIDGIFVLALEDGLLLLTEEGELIEKLTGLNGVPENIKKIGEYDDGRFILATAEGYFLTDIDVGNWQRVSGNGTVWSEREEIPDEFLDRIMAKFRGKGLTVERVILDIHSGRLLGRWGVFIIDTVSILLVISVISGLLMWYKKKKMLAALE